MMFASIAVFIFHSKASHTDSDTLSRQPPDVKAFFFKTSKKVSPAAAAVPGAASAHRLSAASPALRQKWGEWPRCCPGRPWWPPF